MNKPEYSIEFLFKDGASRITIKDVESVEMVKTPSGDYTVSIKYSSYKKDIELYSDTKENATKTYDAINKKIALIDEYESDISRREQDISSLISKIDEVNHKREQDLNDLISKISDMRDTLDDKIEIMTREITKIMADKVDHMVYKQITDAEVSTKRTVKPLIENIRILGEQVAGISGYMADFDIFEEK